MKKIILVLMLLFASMFAFAQDKTEEELFDNMYAQSSTIKHNALYILVQPQDWGYGFRYDYRFNAIGLYTSLSRGEYNLHDGSYIDDHIKVSLGGTLYHKSFLPGSFISYGINYHHYGKYDFTNDLIPKFTFTPISCELGVGTQLNRFIAAFRMDIIKWEASVEIGFIF